MPAPLDAASRGAAEAARGGIRAVAPRRARAAAAAHPAARHGVRHRYAQPYQWHSVCADQSARHRAVQGGDREAAAEGAAAGRRVGLAGQGARRRRQLKRHMFHDHWTFNYIHCYFNIIID